ncbi:hypothetical protein [Candidatus Hakubella thermalkaliphila]|uniref:hypothetical protein n=1 Tax=Candidatus Hakubella thermalkaliphila TaxID=2754717 RepID=UPI00159438CF|nr:hypothetical protein [Candidatus Hakubella thermalkaliphila]
MRKWYLSVVHKKERSVPSDNNFTEVVIGRSKILGKTTRGYKSVEGLSNFTTPTQLAHYFMLLCPDEKRRKEKVPKGKSTNITLKSSGRKESLGRYGGLYVAGGNVVG